MCSVYILWDLEFLTVPYWNITYIGLKLMSLRILDIKNYIGPGYYLKHFSLLAIT